MKFNKKNQQDYLVNEEISKNPNEMVRVVGTDIDSVVVPFKDAINMAESKEMDLIEINSSSKPRIVRIAPYDKFIYEQKKAAKKNKNTVKPLKEIDLSVNIAQNDLETKVRKAKEFIEDGSKVKVVLTMKGRELSRRDTSKKSIFEFIDMISDVASAESMPKDDGNKTSVILKRK